MALANIEEIRVGLEGRSANLSERDIPSALNDYPTLSAVQSFHHSSHCEQ